MTLDDRTRRSFLLLKQPNHSIEWSGDPHTLPAHRLIKKTNSTNPPRSQQILCAFALKTNRPFPHRRTDPL